MDISLGSTTDLDEFIERLEEAGRWLLSRGLPQWLPGSSRAQAGSMAEHLVSGALLCLRDEAGELLGGCLLSTQPPRLWRSRPGSAVYLSKLVVSRAIAGRGWGARIVSGAERWTVAGGRQLLRLDCWEGNDALRSYYLGLGFEDLGSATEGTYRVRLFERGLS